MNYKRITLLQIEYFLAVAKHLNFTEAAKSLYVSQPSLSKHIAILEEEIGVKLFFRTRRNVRLTVAGTVLFKELSGIFDFIQNSIDKVRQPDLSEKSTINIGCLESMDTTIFLPPIIKKFKKTYPDVNLVFERHSFKTLREKLINGTLDVIFTLCFEIDDCLDIVYDIIYRMNSSIVMEASHHLANKENLTMEDIKNEDIIIISRDESPKGFDSIISICKKHGFTPNIIKQLPNIESVLLCVESGMGITLLDSKIRFHNNDNLKFFEIEDDFISVVMAWGKENMNPAISLFTNNVLTEMKL